MDKSQVPQLSKENSTNGTFAIDELLAVNENSNNLSESQALDELLKSNVQDS